MMCPMERGSALRFYMQRAFLHKPNGRAQHFDEEIKNSIDVCSGRGGSHHRRAVCLPSLNYKTKVQLPVS